MSPAEKWSTPPQDIEASSRDPRDIVLTNIDHLIEEEAFMKGHENARQEYEQKGLGGLAKKIKFSFLRQSIIRKHIKEAQKQVKSNTKEILLKSTDAEAAAKDLGLKQKPFIHPKEVEAYHETIALDQEHQERFDDKFVAKRQLLESQLQLIVEDIAKSGKSDQIQTQVSDWVDGAIAKLPKYYRQEDRDIFIHQTSKSIAGVINQYQQSAKEGAETDEQLRIKLHLAGLAKNGGKTKARALLEGLATHPLTLTAATIAMKAVIAAPVVGGLAGAGRKWFRVQDDLKRIELERVHGRQGKQDKYRKELSETFAEQLKASEYIAAFKTRLDATNVENLKDANSTEVDRLINLVAALRAVRSTKLNNIGYTEGQMQRENVQLLKLEREAASRIEKWKLRHKLIAAVRRDITELTEVKDKQQKDQRKLKRNKSLKTGAIVGAFSLGGIGLAAAIPDEWVDSAAEKIADGAKDVWDNIDPVQTASAQTIEHTTDTTNDLAVDAASTRTMFPDTVEHVEGAGEVDLNQVVVEHANTETEPTSLWQELIVQQDQRDQSLDKYITYDNPDVGELNELDIQYEAADGGVVIDISGMEADADGVDGPEFPENEQKYAIFYLTEHDKEIGNEIRIPIPEDGRLVINEVTHPELLPLFETSDGQVSQQFAVLSIGTENSDGSFTFYASNWDNDIPQKVVDEMKHIEETDWPGVSYPNEEHPTTDEQPALPQIPPEDDVPPQDDSGNSFWPDSQPPNEGEVVEIGEDDYTPVERTPEAETTTPPATTEVVTEAVAEDSDRQWWLPFGLTADSGAVMSNLRKSEGQADKAEEIKTPDAPVIPGLSKENGKTFHALEAMEQRQLVSQLERMMNKTPSAEKFLAEHRDSLRYVGRVNHQIYVLTPPKDGTILALTYDESNPTDLKTRFMRMSGSDNQWKSIPGLRSSGAEYLIGDEDNDLHHYVQSGKLHPEVYQLLNQVSEQDGSGIVVPDLNEFMPVKGGRFSGELEIKEDHAHLRNQDWAQYQDQMHLAYEAYNQYIVNNRKPVTLASDSDFIKFIRETIKQAEDKNNPSSSFTKFKPLLDEIGQLELYASQLLSGTPEQIQESADIVEALKSLDLTQPNHPNPKVAHLIEVYTQSVGEFIENVAKIETPPSIKPDFDKANIKQSYFKPNPPGQKETGIYIEEYEKESPEGDKIRWVMAHDTEGRVYIDNVYDPQVGATNYGTHSKIVNMGFLVYKPEDYKNQTIGIPDKYKDSPGRTYVSISRLWSENVPIIKDYQAELNQRGEAIPMPAGASTKDVEDTINRLGGIGKEPYGPPSIFPPDADVESSPGVDDQERDSNTAAGSPGKDQGGAGGIGSNRSAGSGINTENNDHGSGHVITDNSGTVNINYGSVGQEAVRLKEMDLNDRQRERAERADDRRDERRSREEDSKRQTNNQYDERRSRDESEKRQAEDHRDERATTSADNQHASDNLRTVATEALKSNTEISKASIESSTANAKETINAITALIETTNKQIESITTANNESQAALMAQVEASAKSAQDTAQTLQKILESIQIITAPTTERQPTDMKPVFDLLQPQINEQNRILTEMMSEMRNEIRQLNNPDLNTSFTAVQYANIELKQKLRVITSQSFSEMQRARRRQIPRRGPKPRVNRGGGGTPDQPNQPEQPQQTEGNASQPRSMTDEEKQRAIERSRAAKKDEFIGYHANEPFGSHKVEQVRKKAREEMKELYPEQYEAVKTTLRQKITDEYVTPWKNKQSTEDQRRVWLEQLYNQQFYAELVQESEPSEKSGADESNAASSDDSGRAQATTSQSRAESTTDEGEAGYRVKDEDRQDQYEARRNTDQNSQEEYRESQAGRQATERQRQRAEDRARRRTEREQSRAQSGQSQEAAQPSSRPQSSGSESTTDSNATSNESEQGQQVITKVELRNNIDSKPYGLIKALANKPRIDESEKAKLASALNQQMRTTARESGFIFANAPSVLAEIEQHIEALTEKWSTQDQSPQDRIQEARAIYSGKLLNEIIDRINSSEKTGDEKNKSEQSNAGEDSNAETAETVDNTAGDELTQLVNSFGDNSFFSEAVSSVSQLNNEQFGQKYRNLFTQLDELRPNNEDQRYAIASLFNAYNQFGLRLGTLTGEIDKPNFNQIQSEITDIKKEVAEKVENWKVELRPQNVSTQDYKAEQAEKVQNEIINPLREKRAAALAVLQSLNNEIDQLEDQTAELYPSVRQVMGSEDVKAQEEDILNSVRTAAGQLNSQLFDLDASLQKFENVLKEWQRAQ